jgi:hypothetical protein
MKRLLVLVTLLLLTPISSWAQYTAFHTNLYLELTSPSGFYQHLADTATQQSAIQWSESQVFQVVGNIGHRWFAVVPMPTSDVAVFYVRARSLKGKTQEFYYEPEPRLIK